MSTYYFTADNFDPERFRADGQEELKSKEGTVSYSSIPFYYMYPCMICSQIEPGEISPCKQCQFCTICSEFISKCTECDTKGTCQACIDQKNNCTHCTNGRILKETRAPPILCLENLTADYGLIFSLKVNMFGKMSIAFNIDWNNPLHVKYFGDTVLANQPDGVLTKIWKRIVAIYEKISPKYPDGMDQNTVCYNKQLFPQPIRRPPTENEIRKDNTGNLSKKPKIYQKYFKAKYYQIKNPKSPEEMTPEEKKIQAKMDIQKRDGLVSGERPINVFSPTKFFYAKENEVDSEGNPTYTIEQVKQIQSLAAKSITGNFYIRYDSLYLGQVTAVLEKLTQVFITNIGSGRSDTFIDSDKILKSIKLNSNQSRKALEVAKWFSEQQPDVKDYEEDEDLTADGFKID